MLMSGSSPYGKILKNGFDFSADIKALIYSFVQALMFWLMHLAIFWLVTVGGFP
jgi:hypothetical protein